MISTSPITTATRITATTIAVVTSWSRWRSRRLRPRGRRVLLSFPSISRLLSTLFLRAGEFLQQFFQTASGIPFLRFHTLDRPPSRAVETLPGQADLFRVIGFHRIHPLERTGFRTQRTSPFKKPRHMQNLLFGCPAHSRNVMTTSRLRALVIAVYRHRSRSWKESSTTITSSHSEPWDLWPEMAYA